MNTYTPDIMPGAEPFYYPGGRVGCLCLHGLTASPAEVSWLGQDLAAHGLTVYGPRLAGHGTTDHRNLARQRWQDWYGSALDGYHLLRATCDQVFVAGLSMGGLLTLMLGATVPVAGLVVMAAPLTLANIDRLARARWIKYGRPYMHFPDDTDFPQRLSVEQERRGDPVRGRVRYDTWATQALEELYNLMVAVEGELPRITAPALLLYSEGDETVSPVSQQIVSDRIGSEDVRCVTFTRSGHILTQDADYPAVLEQTTAFIDAHTTGVRQPR